MMILERLMEEGKGILVYELRELARDRNHAMFGKTGEDACRISLLSRTTVEDPKSPGAYQMHSSIRNIIVNGTEGEELDMRLVNPITGP
jgi:hypothetical protein